MSVHQIDQASDALKALATSGKPGADALVSQLAGLVVVIAKEAARTESFRDGLAAALAVPLGASAPVTALLDPFRVAEESGPEGLERQLKSLKAPELKKIVKQHWPKVAVSRLKKPEAIETILKRVAASGPEISADGTAEQDLPGPKLTSLPTQEVTVRAKRRRRPSLLNPYAVLRESGQDGLRAGLAALDIEELKDIVVEYGWNYSPAATGWKTEAKIIDRILDGVGAAIERGRAVRGN